MKISVLTPCLNRREFVAEAIDSVLRQDYPDFEHWIIDGGSTDGTLEILRRYRHLKVVSEPDRGVYHALNKGLRLADGDMIALLNTDDLFPLGTFNLCAELFRNSLGTMIVSGGCQIFRRDNGGRETELHRYENPRRYQLSLQNIAIGLPIINARFFRRRVFERLGCFNLDYPIAADRDLLIRAALEGMPDAPVPRILYRYRWHPASLTMNAGSDSLLQGMKDGMKICQRLASSRSLTRRQRTIVNRWRRECLANEVMIYAIQRRSSKALASGFRATQADLLFPTTMLRLGSLAVGRRLRSWYRLQRTRHEP
jgi:glycosyltransferase involved in cell wall biosynthesis